MLGGCRGDRLPIKFCAADKRVYMGKPKRTRTQHVLPFGDLSPLDFERLCFWLLCREGYVDVQHVGPRGTDQGRDLCAIKDGRRWVCQCKRVGQFGPEAVEKEINKILGCPDRERPDDILFVVTCHISTRTRARAREKARGIPCHFWALTELDERVKGHPEIVDEFFQPLGSEPDPYSTHYGFAVLDYLRAIDDLVRRENIQELSVPLAGCVEVDRRFESVEVWNFVNDWISREESTHLAVLGDYGTGKSWLCVRLAKKLGDAFREAPSGRPVPLLLSFKSYRSGMELDEMISRAISRDYGLKDCDSYRIQETLRNRKTILILDGLDEMAREVGRRDALVQFTRLGVPSAARAVVTCRTHYFLSGTEQREVFNPETDVLLRGSAPNFEILHLKLFDETRLEDAIRRRVKLGDARHVMSFVRSTYNLPELCARPVLLALVCESYEALQAIKREVTSADLYESYLKAWLTRELRSGRLAIAPHEVLAFFENLAETLLRRNTLWLRGREFGKRVATFAGELGLSDGESKSLARQLATSTFLKRSGGNGWEFVHRSFQEYLYAKRFFRWECETNGEGDFSVVHVPVWQFVSQIVLREWGEEKALKWIRERVPRDREPSLCKTTLRAAAAFWLLRRGSRPASEYPLRGIMLDCVDLRHVDLSNADLTKADFNRSDLRSANLRGAILCDSVLAGADFAGADLTNADLRGADYRGACFLGTTMSGVLR
ncbi:MAG: pentapeptide repeat-containing protein [Candidatus Zixiibacteriota bacterium]